ncbi:MAG: 23S rRNA (uracil(1939)-C(5))-methyltransferase RlmD [Chitinophagaceae bacterium]|nr:MAG: 23S rRNA (uracil(1939)-C(5))-methyltransferase RlmD [Chitinophagaceae bacterium]
MSRKKKNIVLPQVLVEDYAAEGKSLARVDGKVVFIEGVVPGDVVDVMLGKNKKDWAEGRATKYHTYSPIRVKPFCEHFGVCGGCQWQMLPYEKQLEYKSRQVRDNLQRIAKVPLPEINEIHGALQQRYYRNKMEYTFGNKRFLTSEEIGNPDVSSQMDVAGFHARGMFDKLVDIRKCHLQDEPTNAIRNAIKEFGISNNYTFYDIRNHVGFLRTMQVRLCVSGELMVNVVFGEDNVEERNRLLDHLVAEFPMITTLLYTINTKWNDSMFDLEPVPYKGKGYVMEKLVTAAGQEFQFKIGPKSFFQTNTSQGEKLYQVAADYAELTGNEIVYDLYCGTGSVGIFVSPGAKKIIGVEMIPAAIEDAKENAALNNIPDSAFFAGDVIDICTDDFFAEHGKPDVIITDPPRAGMHEKLVRKILDIAAPVVVYISCNPATQARDLALLDEKYTVTAVQPVDMFPHTLHIENVVQLKLKNPS